jgi:hypothetical protein
LITELFAILTLLYYTLYSIYIFKPIVEDIAAQQELERQKGAGAGAAAATAAAPPGSTSTAKR